VLKVKANSVEKNPRSNNEQLSELNIHAAEGGGGVEVIEKPKYSQQYDRNRVETHVKCVKLVELRLDQGRNSGRCVDERVDLFQFEGGFYNLQIFCICSILCILHILLVALIVNTGSYVYQFRRRAKQLERGSH